MSGDTLTSVEWPRRGLSPAEFAAMCNATSFTPMMKTTQQLIEEAISTGGAIITSDSCHPAEIAIARAQGRFAQHGDYGLILKPARWVKAAQDAHHSRMDSYFDETYTGDISRACIICGNLNATGYRCDDCSKEIASEQH